MSVNPGAGGQPSSEVLPKISFLAQQIRERALSTVIEVDGGINAETASQVVQAGATVLVAGTAVFTGEDGLKLIQAFKLLKGPTRPI